MHKLRTRSLFLPVLLFPFIWSGCGPDDPVEPDPTPITTGTLRVQLMPMWEGAPFVMNSEHINVNDYRVKVEAIKLYLGNVRLVNGAGSTVVKDVEYFDLQNGTATKNWSVAPGTWNGLSAGLGVPASMNNVDPIVYGPGHPLDLANGTHWTWAMGYRFLQFDGRYDLAASSTGPFTSNFSMHTGMNESYEEFDLDLGGDVTVTAGATTTITLHVAVDRFFYSDADTVDLATENQSHGTNLALSQELSRNAANSFSVE